MAFTPTNLAIAELLDTTFISDMKLIINANTTLLKTQIEDVINELEIDLVNKYLGVDTPLNKIFTQDIVVSNSIVFKAGATPSAATIASLTQTGSVSTFMSDHGIFNKTIKLTAAGSKINVPTLVIGTDSSNLPVTNPEEATLAVRGLYVGDATTPIKSRLYGEVEIPKQAIIQSYSSSAGVFSPRQLQLIAGPSDAYTYAKLVVSKTDPQFIYVDLIFPVGYSNYGNDIWLLLHESTSSRPAPGQTFTFIINKVYLDSMVEVTYSALPTVSNTVGDKGINIICGDNSDLGTYKRGHINNAKWTTIPTLDTAAITAIGTDPLANYVRFGNIYTQAAAVFKPKGSSVSFTKSEELPDYANYTITSSSNMVIIN